MKIHIVSLAVLSAALSGCAMFGPDRAPPPAPQPAHYTAGTGSTLRTAADGEDQEFASGAESEAAWWRAYDSDVLDDLVAEGLQNSPSLATAQHALDAARQQLQGQIGTNLLPSVDASFGVERQHSPSLPILPQKNLQYDIFAGGVGASYTFDFFGAAYMSDRALAGQVQQQAWHLDATRRALAANIVKATISAASLQDQVATVAQMADLAERDYRQVAARHQAGSASRDEMLSAEQKAADIAALLPPLKAQLLSVRHAQAVLLGRTPDQAPEPVALDTLHLPNRVPVSVPSELLHHRPDILAAEAAVQVAADRVGAAVAAKYPSLTLSASYGHGGFDWSTFASPAGAIWSVGGALTQPLFHGGALDARKREADAGYDGALSNYRQTVLSAFENVADDLSTLEQDAGALAQAQRADRAAREESLDIERRYTLGAVPYSAALAAGQLHQAAHVQYIRARAARLTDTAALFDAMGDPDAAPRPAADEMTVELLPE